MTNFINSKGSNKGVIIPDFGKKRGEKKKVWINKQKTHQYFQEDRVHIANKLSLCKEMFLKITKRECKEYSTYRS